MFLAIFVFILAVGLVMGGYAAMTYLPGMLERRKMNQRLADVTDSWASQADNEVDLVMRRKDGALPPLDRFLERSRAGGSLARLIEQSGVRATPAVIVMMMVVVGCVVGLASDRLIPIGVLAILLGIAGSFLPIFFLMHRRTRRIHRFEEQFPEALDLCSRALRAGHAFQATLGMVGEELPAPVGPEFKKTYDQQNFGLPLRDSMFQLVERVPLMDVRFFVTAVMIQRESGGNLSEILDNLSRTVRDRFRIRREIRTKTAHGRFTAFVLLALPAALAVILTLLSPEHMAPLFEEAMGRSLLLTAIVMQTFGFFWIRQIIKIEV